MHARLLHKNPRDHFPHFPPHLKNNCHVVVTWNWSCIALIAFLSSLLLFRFAEFTLCCKLFCRRRWPITWVDRILGKVCHCCICSFPSFSFLDVHDITTITDDKEEGDRDGVSGVLVLEVLEDAENLGGRGAREKPRGYARGAELEKGLDIIFSF